MIEKDIVLKNQEGLRARVASNFVQRTTSFVSDIYLEKEEKTYNAKSIMSVLSMGASQGCSLVIRVEGEDEKAAMDGVMDFLTKDIYHY